MKKRWLFTLAGAAFLLTLVLHAPAALLLGGAPDPKKPGQARLHGVYGTLSEGGFAAMSVNNRPVLRSGRWTLHPAWLALLRIAVDFEAGEDAVVRARVSRSVFGTLKLSNLNSAGSVKALLQMAGQPPLPIEGQARLDLPLLRLDKGAPVEADGSIEVESLVWTLAKDPLPLGSFNAALSTDDKGVTVNFGSGPGPLELGGTALLGTDRAYDVNLQLRPRPDATEALLSLLRSLGPPDPQGWYHLRRKGTLAS